MFEYSFNLPENFALLGFRKVDFFHFFLIGNFFLTSVPLKELETPIPYYNSYSRHCLLCTKSWELCSVLHIHSL